MKNSKFKNTIILLACTSMFALPVLASTNNSGDGGSGGNDFEIALPDQIIDLTNTHDTRTITVRGTKTWVDDNDRDGLRPDSITIRLYADGEDTGLTDTISEADNWQYAFDRLAYYSYDSGTEEKIEYSIKEENVPLGYTVKYSEMKEEY